jgi:diguanylate cyclase (GGDEF)-like protein
VVSSLEDIRSNRRLMAHTASAMYGAAAIDGAIEGYLPGDPKFALLPVLVVFVMFVALLAVGPLLPRWGLALLGPVGVALIAYALATSPGPGDGAILYSLPVLWTTIFFGLGGAVAIVACVAVGEAIALLLLPAGSAYPGRWVDVMVSTTAIAIVAHVLEFRSELLLERLRGEARTDPLTGLLNRRGFNEHASRELAHAGRDGRPIGLALFDIDHFKLINDEHGHVVGDRVLVHIARVLSDESRGIDVAARLGGEEFAVLMPGSDVAGADAFAERVRRALTTSAPSDLPEVRVSAGITATAAPLELESMLDRVDRALYRAKRGGRNRTVAFDAHMVSMTV